MDRLQSRYGSGVHRDKVHRDESTKSESVDFIRRRGGNANRHSRRWIMIVLMAALVAGLLHITVHPVQARYIIKRQTGFTIRTPPNSG